MQVQIKLPSKPAWLRLPPLRTLITRQSKHLPFLNDLRVRGGLALVAFLLLAAQIISFIQPFFVTKTYALGPAGSLLLPISQPMADKLHYDSAQQAFAFAGQQPASSDLLGSTTQAGATLPKDAGKGLTVSDPTSKTDLGMTPKFGTVDGKQDGNRIVYPLSNGSGWLVYSTHSIGVKEDILLNSSRRDSQSFEYHLDIKNGQAARLEKDGSIGVYGNSLFSSDISTGSAKDAALLQKARQNAPKNTLLFRIPAPFVKETGRTATKVKAAYQLDGNKLTLTVSGLKAAHYPLAIDPSIYVTSAQQFMNGNNETNIDFDVADALIQKGKTTGARFDSWTDTRSLNNAIWQQGVAVAGGFIYTVGGNYPNGSSSTFNTQGTATYTVPAGFSTITVKVWGGGGGGGAGGAGGTAGGAGGGGGYVKSVLSVTPGESLNLYVASGGAGGAPNSNGGGGGGSGGGYSAISRGSTALMIAAGGAGGGGGDSRSSTSGGAGGAGGGTSGVSGSAAGTDNGGAGGTQSAGGARGTGGINGQDGAAQSGGGGGDGNSASTGGGVSGGLLGGGNGGSGGNATGGGKNRGGSAGGGGGGGGYYGGGGGAGSVGGTTSNGGGGGGGGSSYASGSSIVNTAGSGTAPGNAGDGVRNNAGDGGSGGSVNGGGGDGANGLIIISAGSGATNTSDVTWAQFNTASGTIDSPNPGSGTCGGWCTTSAYSLPAPRSALSLVAYNGFLYAIGGEDTDCTTTNGTGDNGICSTVYIAKLGANGEPRLWHPTDTDQTNWVYWYRSADLTSPRSLTEAIAYNNRMYLLGGKTSSGGTLSVTNSAQVADITATGVLGSWTSSSLPYAVYGHGAQAYNDRLYILGGASSIGGTPRSDVYYTKINSDGSLNNWVQTSSLTGGRFTEGGNFTTSWGGYIYLSGGCTAVNASGYCTSLAGDTQLASINADGSLDAWATNQAVSDSRIGHNVVAWRNNIYEIGGCTSQSSTAGNCTIPLGTIKYGAVNQDGDISSVLQSQPSGSAPCSGSTPYNCNLPPAGSNAGQGGQMLNATAIVNGYLYVAGGCSNASCSTISANTSYTVIDSGGNLTTPANCTANGNTLSGTWCVDSTHNINPGNQGNGNTGVAAAGTAVFGNTIYFAGGINGNGLTGQIYHVTVSTDGSLGTIGWTHDSITTAGAVPLAYSYAYARANPAAAGSAPGNLYIFGGCTSVNGAACTAYSDAVYKCNIQTDSTIAGCTTTGQLQIGTVSGASGAGMAGMGGTVYANYIYLIGGAAPGVSALDTVYTAEIDNNNNVIAASGSAWVLSSSHVAAARSYAAAFGYNGYLYVVGGYGSSGVVGTVEFAKINVSDGSIGSFATSDSTITPSWGMGIPVANSYAYVLGGCGAGAPPASCSNLQATIQSFQIYNNDSGTPAAYSTAAHAYTTNRLGASSTLLNGYLYIAGGCTSATDCTTATTNVSYAQIAADGSVGTWSSTSAALPVARTWGQLEAAGGTLYYVGGQSSTASDERTEVYYATPSNGNVSAWATASSGLPSARTKFGAAVWNNRLYVVGGLDSSAASTATVYVSPQLNAGGNITGSWTTSTAFNVARSGLTVVAYANNLYILGGNDGSNYLSDTQYAQIISDPGQSDDGTVSSWTYSASLPQPISQASGFAANGYIYLIGGRSADTTCTPVTLVAPISANTTIASGNKPTGIGQWFQTGQNYSGDRYGNAAVYYDGKAYVLGGACGSTLSYASPAVQQASLLSQPQVAKYSIMLDTDDDVFPNQWLLNGVDNSIGAKWQLTYRSMTNTTTLCTSPAMTTWGQATNFGDVTLGLPGVYTPKNGSGTNTNCARFFDFNVSVDSSQAFGYPDDVTRGPTITDLTLQFTANASKRLMHGRTFTGGLQQPDDTPYYTY